MGMRREDIEQGFADAGWELDGDFSEVMVIGFSGNDVSLLAHKETWGAESHVFELLDHERMVGCWVEEIPTPQQAEELLREWGKPHEQGESVSL